MSEQARIIRWENPPPSRGGPGPGTQQSRFRAVADALRAAPGRWAVITEDPDRTKTALAFHIRTGGIECFAPGGDFEAVQRQVGGVLTVYARYLGDGEASDA